MKFGLRDEVISSLKNVFTHFSQIDEVIIYGSRAKGTQNKGSDIDLTLFGKDLDLELLYKLQDKIEELNLIYILDISIYKQIDNQNLKDHIKRVGKIFYKKGSK
ncbi:MAG: DNA polymerase beta domain protein region [uncultured Campylobacterales bacterium]|uniref:DNA polymerase beta domain protein region n=1 Tax=uncultured Campylobacterales bacterium TaxID=352960 RepID=A0A6S6TD98_9BACT|nr:MAG: DNA polymerase beta domain protein region [uncultured Campylobacterales bacterium]